MGLLFKDNGPIFYCFPNTMELEYLKVSYFRGEKYSREFIFAKKQTFAEFAKFSSRKIFKKRTIREIRENLFQRNVVKTTIPRNSPKFGE